MSTDSLLSLREKIEALPAERQDEINRMTQKHVDTYLNSIVFDESAYVVEIIGPNGDMVKQFSPQATLDIARQLRDSQTYDKPPGVEVRIVRARTICTIVNEEDED